MLANWLQPVGTEVLDTTTSLASFQFGQKIAIYEEEIPSLKAANLAIVGIDAEVSDLIRKELYKLSYPFKNSNIVDLGNLRKVNTDVLVPVISELLQANIFPILIGRDQRFTLSQYQAYQSLEQLVNLVLIDKAADLLITRKRKIDDRYFLNQILKKQETYLFNLGLIGYQSHYVDPAVLRYFAKNNFDYQRLGYIRSHLNEAEPIIRDADMVSIDISAVRQSEAPGSPFASPSGFYAEEICKLAHYAGLSDKLSSIGFYGLSPEHDRNQQTVQLFAQMIWYFIDGFMSRKSDYPMSTDGLVEYVVDFKNADYQITFWKSKKSDRWWMQVPTRHKKRKRHRLIPCSYSDYKQACKSELPERLINAYNRFM